MKFELTVELPEDMASERREKELSRILRYWAGNMKHYELVDGDSSEIYDSEYRQVGTWTISE
ncbi:hypothetical protein [Salininema proteolyticum]|uniref:Uncharacterized protein n=1 Tax=Salininema proteolyticum TaxID=1607685 RepID=A0ABV8TVY6_9ACTN